MIAKSPNAFNEILIGLPIARDPFTEHGRTYTKEEVGAMLDRNRGDLDAMIADLRNAN